MESTRTKTVSNIIVIISFVIALFYWRGDNASKIYDNNYFLDVPISNGDIILRRGSGIVSDVARNFSEQDKRYSHVGILHRTREDIFVIHSLMDDEKGFDGVVKETLSEYLANINEWAIYRLNEDIKIRDKVALLALNAVDIGVKFDNEFDLTTEDRLYCTEFVQKMVNVASGKEIIHSNTIKLGKLYTSVSDVYFKSKLLHVANSKN